MSTLKKIAIGGDHAGYAYKKELIVFLENEGYTVDDHGTNNPDSVDYPDFAHPTATAVERGTYKAGILICGSANGVAITANKHQGIRAAICWNPEIALLARQHNDANIICLPARFTSLNDCKEMIKVFLETEFEGGRHQTRVNKIACS
ncbi:ribose 5-phosphate isomerase B [Olivibacter sp. SDN3]|uniref:ribose 5-phosphate isomerase B n=1 Tax=Olivibacter sp. SDN3 TaxID=2764720 RepID=UPI0016512A67|nr:ribose 5-phosphate isomerase B [Olivibacter sp. SDN3]QNL50080.1 ribose 5-phosphate isomerase B [Olivibacter sp. SDN3]